MSAAQPCVDGPVVSCCGGLAQRRVAACAAALLLASCGGSASAPPAAPLSAPAPPSSEFRRRQDAACVAAGRRVIGCALDDLCAKSTPQELAKLDVDKMRQANEAKYVERCQADQLSSRQLRVYEVCVREETACEPFFACLDHLKPQPAPGG